MSGQVRVLIADKMDPKAAAIFRERGIEVDEKPGLTPDELKAIAGDYVLFFEHDPINECCTLERTEKGVRGGRTFRLDEL